MSDNAGCDSAAAGRVRCTKVGARWPTSHDSGWDALQAPGLIAWLCIRAVSGMPTELVDGGTADLHQQGPVNHVCVVSTM